MNLICFVLVHYDANITLLYGKVKSLGQNLREGGQLLSNKRLFTAKCGKSNQISRFVVGRLRIGYKGLPQFAVLGAGADATKHDIVNQFVATGECVRDWQIIKKRKSLNFRFCTPSGARTLDPNIKSVVLYQLS